MLKVVVCGKQIPDFSHTPTLNENRCLVRDRGKVILDEADSYAVEVALELVEAQGGETTVISVAPNQETAGLRTALAMGIDCGIVVSDDALSGSDSLATAKVLAAVARRLGPDLLIAATESTDGCTGTLAVQVAELLELPAITSATDVKVSGSSVTATRQTAAGMARIRSEMPAVVTVTAGVVRPRYPSFKSTMIARSKPIEVLTLAELGVDQAEVGWSGARQEIVDVSPNEKRQQGEIVADDGDGHLRIVELLKARHVL